MWQMPFNASKCTVLHLGCHNNVFDYFMDNHKLDAVTEEKDLGILITINLKSASQCQQAYAKASKALGIIARTIQDSTCSAESLYLEYCVPAWSPHYEKDKVLLERVQHRFTRMVPGLRQLTYEQRLKRLGLWTLEKRRNRADLLEVFKMYKGLSLTSFSRFFTISIVSSTRGHTAKIVKSHCHLDIRRFFFSQRVIERWNGLPQSVISSNSINSFKNGLNAKRKVSMGYFMD